MCSKFLLGMIVSYCNTKFWLNICKYDEDIAIYVCAKVVSLWWPT